MEINPEESVYKWFDAAKSYEKDLNSKAANSLVAERCERIGFCYSMASRQTKTVEEFKSLRQAAVDAYQKAGQLFKRESEGESLKCFALAEHTRSWLEVDPADKRRALERCLRMGKEALKEFKNAKDGFNFGATCNLLGLCILDLHHVIPTSQGKRSILREGLGYANDAVKVFSSAKEREELTIALCVSSLLSEILLDDHQEERSLAGLCVKQSERAWELSKNLTNPYLKAMACWAEANCIIYLEEKMEKRRSLFYPREMLRQATIVRDNYLKGNAWHLLAYAIFADVLEEVNPAAKKQRCEDIVKYSEKAIENLQLVCQDATTAVTHLFISESSIFLAKEFAATQPEKLRILKKAIKAGERGLDYANRSGSPYALQVNLHSLSRAYFYYSILEPVRARRKGLLNKGLGYNRLEIASIKKAFRSNFWYTGVGMVHAAQIEAELARLEEDEKRKMLLFEEAVAFMRNGILNCKKTLDFTEVPAAIVRIAESEDTLGGLLEDCFSLTKNPINLAKANEVYKDSANQFTKIHLPSRVAECHWRIAQNNDSLGDYREAAIEFEAAQTAYELAAQKMPDFKDFYIDYASYVKAWSEIEKAKLEHGAEKYLLAEKHYEKASHLLKRSKPWAYLHLNFQAWSQLEHAEDMSRKENSDEAVKLFKQAIKSFQESKNILTASVTKIEKTDEKELAKQLIQVSDARADYSLGRIAVEQAKFLDKNGDPVASSEKYGKAAEIFEQILWTKPAHISNEVKPLFHLCRAWQKMTLAEARVSPTMYEEAAELFRLANESSPNKSASLLALAHSSFCKALGAGTTFETTRSEAAYTDAKKHLNAAAEYYLKAGYEGFSDYATATQRLFDAYIYTDRAKKETEPEREAKYYSIAEKVLQKSFESYANAKYTEKANQVRRLLKKVGEEKALAISLSEVMHAPVITSSTASLATLSLTEEKPVGLERFRHADIQAKLTKHEGEVKVGNYVSLEIQIVNVGKEPVLLTKIENILPAGFQLVGKPDFSSIHEDSLVFEGKQLSPLRTDKTKIILRPSRRGSFVIRPRITCADQSGHFLAFTPESLTLEVSATVLPNRVSTGFSALDDVLLGGIPEKYAIVLCSPSNDTREKILHGFLDVEAKRGEITFLLTSDVAKAKILAEEFRSNFYVFVCNPRADSMIENMPNVFRLGTVENLTEINIALVKAFKTMLSSCGGSKRICIEILSDVLLTHHAVITRKWLSQLLPDLRSRGFTTLVIVNPQMHPTEELQAILGQFEGEVQICEREGEKEIQQFLRVRKLYNQNYSENEVAITRAES
jgi:hypothetical protein